MRRRVVGIDIGGEIARFVEGRLRKGAFEIHAAGAVPRASLGQVLAEHGLTGARCLVGVTGRDMILRTNQVPPVPMWQLQELMAFEVEDVAEQSGDALRADFNLLGGAAAFTDEEMALLALVRNSHIDERTAELSAAGLQVEAFSPNAVALHNAVVATDGGEGTVLAACLRGRNTDVALLHDGELLFARNLTGGGDTFTDAVAESFGIDRERAEQAKRKVGSLARPGENPAGQAGAVARALEGALRQVVGMLQSTVALCRSQIQAPNLQVERVLLCGPGAELPGLDEALTRALGLPVARFDPTEGYVVADVPELERGGGAFAVPTGLAMAALLKGSYRIEVLSAAAERSRRFRDRTLWLVLAAAALLVHLGLFAWIARADHDRARSDQLLLARALESRKAASNAYRRSLDKAAELSARLDVLADTTAPGAGVLTVLELLDAHLPPELWVTAVRSVRAAEPAFGHGGRPRPFVVVEGSGKELERGLSDAVVDFTTLLRSHPAVAAVVPRLETDARGRFTFELRIDTLVVPGAATAGVEEDAGAAPEGGR